MVADGAPLDLSAQQVGLSDIQRAYADTLIRVPQAPTLLQPLVSTVPLQVFACELALARGNDVDQPRNLAKSVTVV